MHAGHRDRGADLGDRGAADGAVGEDAEVEHRLRGAPLVPHEGASASTRAERRTRA